MVKINWSATALEDLEEIIAYIARDSERYAERVAGKIYQRVQVLERHPLSGRVVPEMADENVRELIEGNYRIIYEIESSEEVLILTVHHSARLL